MSLFDFLSFGWLRNIVGTRKDLVDTKKSQLEIRKLVDEEIARNLITKATIADIEKYDPKIEKIKRKVELQEEITSRMDESGSKPPFDWSTELFWILCGIVICFVLVLLIIIFIDWISYLFGI
jgi:hypothetical protein